jgi:hypothetical protein
MYIKIIIFIIIIYIIYLYKQKNKIIEYFDQEYYNEYKNIIDSDIMKTFIMEGYNTDKKDLQIVLHYIGIPDVLYGNVNINGKLIIPRLVANKIPSHITTEYIPKKEEPRWIQHNQHYGEWIPGRWTIEKNIIEYPKDT